MAKVSSYIGVATGKVGTLVAYRRNGSTIIREWVPSISNPKSKEQTDNRAKFKLMSQLGKVVSPFLAYRVPYAKLRNSFVAKNFKHANIADNTAGVNLLSLDLTGGVSAMPAVNATISGSVLSASLQVDFSPFLDAVVYGVLESVNEKITSLPPVLVSTPGADGHFGTTIDITSVGKKYVYAYGLKTRDAATRVIFEDLVLRSASSEAIISWVRTVQKELMDVSATVATVVTTAA